MNPRIVFFLSMLPMAGIYLLLPALSGRDKGWFWTSFTMIGVLLAWVAGGVQWN